MNLFCIQKIKRGNAAELGYFIRTPELNCNLTIFHTIRATIEKNSSRLHYSMPIFHCLQSINLIVVRYDKQKYFKFNSILLFLKA